MKDLSSTWIALLVLSLFTSPAWSQHGRPTLVLFNGKVFTSDSSHPYVEALAVQGDRIIAVGTSKKIIALSSPRTKRIDLRGHVAIPGFNDAHYHLNVEPKNFHLRFQGQDPTWQEVKNQLTVGISKASKGTPIFGDIGPTVLYEPQATRDTLDQLAPEHPVILFVWTGHASICNSAALKMLDVKEDEPDPLGGSFTRSREAGSLTGSVFEFAQFRLARRLSELASEAQALQQTREYIAGALRLGITSVQVMSMPPSAERLVTLFKEAPTQMRVRIIRFHLTDQNGRIPQEGQNLPRYPSSLITVSGTKWVLDGTPVERSSAMRQPYSDKLDTSGQLNFSQTDLVAMLHESLASRDQLLVHVVGDRTTEVFIARWNRLGARACGLDGACELSTATGLPPI